MLAWVLQTSCNTPLWKYLQPSATPTRTWTSPVGSTAVRTPDLKICFKRLVLLRRSQPPRLSLQPPAMLCWGGCNPFFFLPAARARTYPSRCGTPPHHPQSPPSPAGYQCSRCRSPRLALSRNDTLPSWSRSRWPFEQSHLVEYGRSVLLWDYSSAWMSALICSRLHELKLLKKPQETKYEETERHY